MGPLLAMLLTVAPPTGFTVSIERLDVQRTSESASVTTEPLAMRVELKGLTFSGKAPRLCPAISKKDGIITLRCTTRRLWAALEKDERGTYVSLRLLSGTAFQQPEVLVPMRPYSVTTMGIPDSCPGKTAAVIAECALAKGDLVTAKKGWEDALLGPDSAVGHLRLGDLAMQSGDIESALHHFTKVSFVGPLGRLAEARACELIGTCLAAKESARVGNRDGLPPEVDLELQKLNLRRDLTAGRDVEAMSALHAALEKNGAFCEGAIGFCQKVIEAGLVSDDQEARIAALAVFLTDKARRGPFEATLTLEAAEAAKEVGAPGFAASILAANTPHVPKADLGAHLQRIVELYLAAGDRVRAEAILDYADAKLGPGGTKSSVWKMTRKRVGTRHATVGITPVVDDAALEAFSSEVTLSTDLARAASARSRAVENAP